MTAAEQERVKAKCEMAAVEASSGHPSWRDPRFRFLAACLTAKGFVRERVSDD